MVWLPAATALGQFDASFLCRFTLAVGAIFGAGQVGMQRRQCFGLVLNAHDLMFIYCRQICDFLLLSGQIGLKRGFGASDFLAHEVQNRPLQGNEQRENTGNFP